MSFYFVNLTLLNYMYCIYIYAQYIENVGYRCILIKKDTSQLLSLCWLIGFDFNFINCFVSSHILVKKIYKHIHLRAQRTIEI